MTKKAIIKLLEDAASHIAPYTQPDYRAADNYRAEHQACMILLSAAEKVRRYPTRQTINNRMRDSAMRSIGLTKVRGKVSGKIYWE